MLGLLCFVDGVAAFGRLKIRTFPEIKISVLSGDLQDWYGASEKFTDVL